MKNCPSVFYICKAILRIGSFLIFYSVFFLSCKQQIFAADTINTSFAIANYLPIVDTSVSNGDIVSFSPSVGYLLSKTPYDAGIVGVVSNNPAISLETNGNQRSYPVVSTGDTLLNVTTINGNIKKGDPITTSHVAGKGMKATTTGYIVGSALEAYTSADKNAVKQIVVTLNVHYYVAKGSVSSSLFDIFNLSALATYEEPLQVFKYFMAALILVLSFIFGFFSFARTANKGLEALGRNPLASRMIEFGMLLNIIVAIIIILSGLVIAFFVIRL